MSETIFQTSIWKNTLDSESNFSGEHKDKVDILRTVFLQARENAKIIAENIKESQPGLTIHDVTHLDALWETTDIIATKNIEINPIEAFVLGCSILFHDLGMALYVWEEKIDQLKKSAEFKDVAFELLRKKLDRHPTKKEILEISAEDLKIILSIIFREHHADKAKDLPLKKWNLNDTDIYIIENLSLREKLGNKIGTIAQSHWWSVEQLNTYFNESISSAPTGFPVEWKINNIKIASLLRIADYINIDDRRAPTFYFALINPANFSKLSLSHWTFQNKLNRPFIDEQKLVFESKSPFGENESDAWWLAYNTINDIDKEVRKVNDLLFETSKLQLNCLEVKGVTDPILFSSFVKAEQWSPVNTQYKISDLLSIINKLGGIQLYGDRKDVPIRELIQNANDAINAKQVFVPNYNNEIVVNFYVDDISNEWLEIKDNGIGMSKSTLLYYLLDFGKSYWNSELIRKEYKGLVSSSFKSTGKYGIGFFSVFMIAKEITVSTKSLYGNETFVLEFKNGLESNPIFKISKEVWFESGTSIKLKLLKQDYFDSDNFITTLFKTTSITVELPKDEPLSVLCEVIAPALTCNLSVKYFNQIKKNVIKPNDWEIIDPLKLLLRIYCITQGTKVRPEVFEYAKFISQFISPIISNKDGKVLGRATLLFKKTSARNFFKGIVTAGSFKESLFNLFSGLWLGENEVVTRDLAIPLCSYNEFFQWLEKQYQILFQNIKQFESDELYEIASVFFSFGFECKQIPIAYDIEGYLTFEDILKKDFGDHVLIRPVIQDEERELKPVKNILYSKFTHYETSINYSNTFEILWSKEINNFFLGKGFSYHALHNYRALFALTLLAVSKAWDVPLNEILNESFLNITQWHPIMNVYQDKNEQDIKKDVLIIVNPRQTTKKEIAKKYSNEIRKWIGINENDEFDIEKFY